jgi:hypothetical protein
MEIKVGDLRGENEFVVIVRVVTEGGIEVGNRGGWGCGKGEKVIFGFVRRGYEQMSVWLIKR